MSRTFVEFTLEKWKQNSDFKEIYVQIMIHHNFVSWVHCYIAMYTRMERAIHFIIYFLDRRRIFWLCPGNVLALRNTAQDISKSELHFCNVIFVCQDISKRRMPQRRRVRGHHYWSNFDLSSNLSNSVFVWIFKANNGCSNNRKW